MRKISLLALSLLVLTALCSAPAIAKQAKETEVKVSNAAIANMTWEVFAGGCFESDGKVAEWANKQIFVRKAKIEDKSKIGGLWKNLGYPVPDQIIDLWGTIGKRVWLYQHERKGCTVTSYADISPQMLETAFDNLGKSFAAKSGASYNVKAVNGSKATVVLMVLGPERKVKTYLMARILPANKTGIKTILYLFRSDKNVNL